MQFYKADQMVKLTPEDNPCVTNSPVLHHSNSTFIYDQFKQNP